MAEAIVRMFEREGFVEHSGFVRGSLALPAYTGMVDNAVRLAIAARADEDAHRESLINPRLLSKKRKHEGSSRDVVKCVCGPRDGGYDDGAV